MKTEEDRIEPIKVSLEQNDIRLRNKKQSVKIFSSLQENQFTPSHNKK